MLIARRPGLTAGLALLSGCSGNVATSSLQAGGGRGIIYPITAEEADRVIATAMVGEFAGSAISGIALPNKGYIATIQFFLDSHRISAVAIPTMGVGPAGTQVPGFSFEVSHQGTMMLTAPPRADSLFQRINLLAAAIKPPIPAA